VADDEEVPVRHLRPAPRRRPTLLVVASLAALVLVAGCGSDTAPVARSKPNPIHQQNERYLLKLHWKPEQARCVGRRVEVDLEELLKGGQGDPDPTKSKGYEQFAAAVRTCIDRDPSIVTTTTGA
jgi:hypothetical protein